MPAVRELLRVRRDARVQRDDQGRTFLEEGHMRAPLGALSEAHAEALAALRDGAGEDEILEAAGTQMQTMLGVRMLLGRLERGGWLERSVVSGERELATLVPLGHVLKPGASRPGPDTPVVLSRFAHVRVVEGTAVLETPRFPARVRLPEPAVLGVVAALALPGPLSALAVDGLDAEEITAVTRLLWSMDAVVAPGEEDERTLAVWSFAELLAHQRSRIGHHVGDYGGSYRFAERFDPLPAVREPRPEAEPLALPQPAPGGDDPPLSTVLEERSSVRRHDDEHPLDLARLSTFLHRCARNRGLRSDGSEEVLSRPYPAGGSLYELELYPLVHTVAGLEPGLYHYDPQGHALALVRAPGPEVTLLLEYAKRTAVMEAPPQVVILIAARFGRVMWKYESMAYALILKHVGVLYQTMYLVATAMGLAPCALGGGNADAFAAAAGTDPYAEGSVGEFVLGSRPAAD